MIEVKSVKFVDYKDFYDEVTRRSVEAGHNISTARYVVSALFYYGDVNFYCFDMDFLSRYFYDYVICQDEERKSCRKIFDDFICPLVKELGFDKKLILGFANDGSYF